jgi:hypothetical protein
MFSGYYFDKSIERFSQSTLYTKKRSGGSKERTKLKY